VGRPDRFPWSIHWTSVRRKGGNWGGKKTIERPKGKRRPAGVATNLRKKDSHKREGYSSCITLKGGLEPTKKFLWRIGRPR